LKELEKSKRENYIFASGAGNLIITYQNLRKALEKRLRQLKTEYLDIFYFLGVTKEKEFPERAREEMLRFKEEGKVRAIGMSSHDRAFAGKLAAENSLDVLMVRYNAAHRGAEQDIFPHLKKYNPGVVSFTATRWRYLMRQPRGWPKSEQLPSAGMAYRYVLSNPHVHLCMMAPSNIKQFKLNLAEINNGKLDAEEEAFMLKFGDAVYHQKKWFM
jgi:aryl-alcohol dehydrogenase-like predicted oxidoreductase